MTNNLTLSCVVTVDLTADKYSGETEQIESEEAK
jgi:hypothetical protein